MDDPIYSNFHEVINAIANAEYQAKAWFGSDLNLMDSPGEQIHALLGAGRLDHIVETRRFNLDERVYDLLLKLKAAILAYQAEVGLDPDPRITIDHPKWEAIRAIAREIQSLLPERYQSQT
ncbi:hypothetical protein [Microvirga brassicacearum]|uniref:Uncharacterized protein n=1 Tax=Microvirga brassicacearum TaxID=2580413 RepID=A0A5N3P4L8_9HYPH|nr:hypothetical protein [Microvirga brassicacearum]KAB0264664.1 hypothetical protein FEZ63_21670 [Microvirga brassicacearum]